MPQSTQYTDIQVLIEGSLFEQVGDTYSVYTIVLYLNGKPLAKL